MKCIKSIKATKNTEIGVITRIDDNEAELKVKGGYWYYIPKSEWKEYKCKSKKTEQVEDQSEDQVVIKKSKKKNEKN
jgi:hypothetical protein